MRRQTVPCLRPSTAPRIYILPGKKISYKGEGKIFLQPATNCSQLVAPRHQQGYKTYHASPDVHALPAPRRVSSRSVHATSRSFQPRPVPFTTRSLPVHHTSTTRPPYACDPSARRSPGIFPPLTCPEQFPDKKVCNQVCNPKKRGTGNPCYTRKIRPHGGAEGNAT